MKSERRQIELLLFAAAFIAFGYFHQGGGWNANSRFAMVRAIVEQGKLSIDSYLIYTPVSESGTELRRIHLENASYDADGKTNVLVWLDRQGKAFPTDPKFEGQTERNPEKFNLIDLKSVAASGDVSYDKGHFYPNKAPGTSFIAVPAYWIIYNIDRLIGANPDSWWTLTLNAWLTCMFSVSLLSAFGVVLFHRFALSVSGSAAAVSLFATIAFAFGTMFFPYATTLYEHNIIGVCLLASFYLIYRARTADKGANTSLFVSGWCAGYAAITNYIIAAMVILLGIYLVATARRKSALIWFGAGVLGPFLLICAYNIACFGTPFTTNYRYQNPYFQNSGAFLGVFGPPRFDVLIALLFSPFRGLFFSSPVLLTAVAGLVILWRNPTLLPETILILAAMLFFLLINISFEEWHGGWAVAPRYLGPGVPFLALGLVPAFMRLSKITVSLGVVSIAIMVLVTAVDPEPPIGISDTAQVLNKPLWQNDPINEYDLPIFLNNRPTPLLHQLERQVIAYYGTQLAESSLTKTERMSELDRFRRHINELVTTAQPAPLVVERQGKGPNASYSIKMSDLPTIVGPVSVSVGGVYGGGLLGTDELQWNSFNVGEFLFPQSRWSLLPLLLMTAPLCYLAIRTARRADRAAA